MKEKWFENLIREAKQTKLTASEKQHMLSAILGDVRMPSPYVFALAGFIRTYHRQAVAFAMVFVVIVTTGGTSFAAEKALPGDTLYSIKVNVNEEIQSFVALSPVAKARVGIERATKRLKEAEQLAVEGRLTPEAQDIIKDKIKEHGEVIKENINVLATSDEAAAKEVVSDFKASIEAVVPSAPAVAIASAPATEEAPVQAKIAAEPEVSLFATTMVAEDAPVETSLVASSEAASTTTDIVLELDAQAIGLISIAEELKAEITIIEEKLATSSPETVIEVQ